jgi:DNA adenine methylase
VLPSAMRNLTCHVKSVTYVWHSHNTKINEKTYITQIKSEWNQSLEDRDMNHARPFLRWVGGKTKLVKFLECHFPPRFSDANRYFESFLGGGSLFFRLNPKKATLSDNNGDLIECYRAVQKYPELIIEYLERHLLHNCEKYYYKMRDEYNKSEFSISKAALFIYLNKTCFNGIWRVNLEGHFNVPYGFKEPPCIPSKEELLKASEALSGARILQMDYKRILRYVKKGDFVYFDPPYPPLNGTSNFTHYTRERFAKGDHFQLAQIAERIRKKGCYILISNADMPYIRSLYEENFNIFEIEVTRWIRTDGKRYKVKEIAITNYEV